LVVSGVNVRTSVHVTARSYSYLANEINRIFLETITRSGLDPTELSSVLDTIENGLRTWLALRQLEVAYLEVYDAFSEMVLSRVDLNIEYTDVSGDERYHTDVERVRRELDRSGQFAGCRYRVVVMTTPGAAQVRGWSTTTLKDVSHLTRRNIGQVIDTAAAGACMSIFS